MAIYIFVKRILLSRRYLAPILKREILPPIPIAILLLKLYDKVCLLDVAVFLFVNNYRSRINGNFAWASLVRLCSVSTAIIVRTYTTAAVPEVI